MFLDALALGQIAPQLISQVQKRTRPSVFEDVQTPFEYPIRKSCASFLDGFEYLAQVFGRMGEIQDALRIRSMLFCKSLTPVGPIGDGTDLLRLSHPAPLYLHIYQLGKGGGIGEPREIRELTNVGLWFSLSALLLLWLANGQGAHFHPLLVKQGNHGPIDTHDAPLWRWLIR